MPLTRGPAPDFQLQLPADHELVLTTPMLQWVVIPGAQGAAPLAGISLFKAVRAFLSRCSLSRTPEAATTFSQTSFLQFDLTVAAWTRILDEFDNSDLPRILRDSYAASLLALDDAIKQLTPANPNNLIIHGADLLLRDSFDDPGAPAVPANNRGRARQAAAPAVPATPGPAELSFLNLCTLSHLEDQGSVTTPLLPLSRLAGMVGPYSTRAVRLNLVSTIQLTGALVRQELRNRFGCQADGAMAVNLKDFVMDTYLPSVFCATVASEEELRREARDACAYRRSTQGRIDVEISRVPYLRTRYNSRSIRALVLTPYVDPTWPLKERSERWDSFPLHSHSKSLCDTPYS